eukprot:scaffold12554_cov90-Isochrysis_galbana.AAC.1
MRPAQRAGVTTFGRPGCARNRTSGAHCRRAEAPAGAVARRPPRDWPRTTCPAQTRSTSERLPLGREPPATRGSSRARVWHGGRGGGTCRTEPPQSSHCGTGGLGTRSPREAECWLAPARRPALGQRQTSRTMSAQPGGVHAVPTCGCAAAPARQPARPLPARRRRSWPLRRPSCLKTDASPPE